MQEKVFGEATPDKSQVQEWWQHNDGVIRKWAKEILGDKTGYTWVR